MNYLPFIGKMSEENDFDVKNLWKSFNSDVGVLSTSLIILLFSCVVGVHIRLLFLHVYSFKMTKLQHIYL